MSMGKIGRNHRSVRHERYRFPVRPASLDPEKERETQAAGLLPWSDKLVDEVIRLLLQAYHEPTFSDRSHGFRPGRGCHTALSEVKYNWTGTIGSSIAPLTHTFIERAHELMHDVIESGCRSHGKSFYIDHTPRHALCIDDIWGLFPHAKIVHVVRHPAAVVDSLTRSYESGYKWAGKTITERLALWRQHVQAVRSHEDDERIRVIPYEDLCARPMQETRLLFDWAGLPWDENVLDEFVRPHVPNAGRPFALAERAPTGLTFKPLPKLEATPELLSSLTDVDSELQHYGYDLPT